MNEIQKKAEELLKLMAKNKKLINRQDSISDIEKLEKATQKFTGYKVNTYGTLVAIKKGK